MKEGRLAAAPEAAAWEVCFYIWGVWICISDRLSAAQWSACYSLMAPAVQQQTDARIEQTQDCTARHCVTIRSPHQVGTPPIHASWVALSLIRLHNLEYYMLSYFLSLYSILSAYFSSVNFCLFILCSHLKSVLTCILVCKLCILRIYIALAWLCAR